MQGQAYGRSRAKTVCTVRSSRRKNGHFKWVAMKDAGGNLWNPYKAMDMYKRTRRQEGGLMDLGGMEKDYRENGGFVPLEQDY